MPANITVSHVSPLVSYIPRSAWFEASTFIDPDLDEYPWKSYHATNASASGNASFTFSWWGSGIWIHGGYRKWSSGYQVILDDRPPQLYEGYDSGDEIFDQVLYQSPDLVVGPHHIRITNAGHDVEHAILDFEYLVFESPLDLGDVVPHNSSDCMWGPQTPSAWQVDELSHSTNNSLGFLELNFTGESLRSHCGGIVLYGTLDGASAPLSISLDGQADVTLTPNTAIDPATNASHVLYFKDNLIDGNHTLRVENNPVSSGPPRMSISHSQILVDARTAQPPLSSPPDPPQPRRTILVVSICAGVFGFFVFTIVLWKIISTLRRNAAAERKLTEARPFYPTKQTSKPKRLSDYILGHTRNHSSSTPTADRAFLLPHAAPMACPHGCGGFSCMPLPDYATAEAANWLGGTDEPDPIVAEVDALHRSFTRMRTTPRRPPPVTVAPGPGSPTSHSFSHSRSHSRASLSLSLSMGSLFRPASVASTASSHTACDSCLVHASSSPDSPQWPPDPREAGTRGGGTAPLRVSRRRRDSIEKPQAYARTQTQTREQTRWVPRPLILTGSPVVTTAPGSLMSPSGARSPSVRTALTGTTGSRSARATDGHSVRSAGPMSPALLQQWAEIMPHLPPPYDATEGPR